jgi:gamma-polyglutamate biosynthesis protein CapC
MHFVIPIFPENSTALALSTTVWIGVLVVAFFNLRFGWPMSGLVVPGYLVPLLMAKPTSAVITVIEAVLTYLIVYFLSEKFNRWPYWCSFFGRDRFFAIVLVSVLVRALMDGWLLPSLGVWVNQHWRVQLDYRNHLHSYGLIVVALIANLFWKPGLIRGSIPFAVTVGLTFLILRWLVIEWTNFSVASLEYIYEDIAISILASPKTYIILIITSYIASRMNLRYSWDFNGILVPALLALQWHNPFKIMVSFAEAMIVLSVATRVAKLPIFQRTTIEGARKIVLFFTVAFFYRQLMVLAIPIIAPDLKTTDAFGFGYLLSTLIAIKAADKKTPYRIVRATMQISALGAVAGSLVGFVLAITPATWTLTAESSGIVDSTHDVRNSDSIDVAVLRDKLKFCKAKLPHTFLAPSALERERFVQAIALLQRYRESRDEAIFQRAQSCLNSIQMGVTVHEDRFVHIFESDLVRGFGAYVIDLDSPQGVVMTVPQVIDHWGMLESALALFHQCNAGALVLGGAPFDERADTPNNLLKQPNSLYAAFHQAYRQDQIVELRASDTSSIDLTPTANPGDSEATSEIWIKRSIPNGFNLNAIKSLLHPCRVKWGESPRNNIVRDQYWSGYAEVQMDLAARQLLSRSTQANLASSMQVQVPELTGDMLRPWLLDRKGLIAPMGSNSYISPLLEELVFLDEQLIAPLSGLLNRYQQIDDFSPNDRSTLDQLALHAALLNLQMLIVDDKAPRSDLILFTDTEDPSICRHWGTFVFRLGLPSERIIEIPRPLYDRTAYDVGAMLFERLQASALLIAGSHPEANADSSADVTRATNRSNPFHLVHSVFLRELGSRPMIVLQAQAMNLPSEADLLLAAPDRAIEMERLSPVLGRLTDELNQGGIKVGATDGSPEQSSYQIGHSLQSDSLELFENKEFAMLWLSPMLRDVYRAEDETDGAQQSRFTSVDIESTQFHLADWLAEYEPEFAQKRVVALEEPQLEMLFEFLTRQDVVQLKNVVDSLPNCRFTRVIDQRTRQAFLVLESRYERAYPFVVRLAEPIDLTPRQFPVSRGDAAEVSDFLDSTATWMEVQR